MFCLLFTIYQSKKFKEINQNYQPINKIFIITDFLFE